MFSRNFSNVLSRFQLSRVSQRRAHSGEAHPLKEPGPNAGFEEKLEYTVRKRLPHNEHIAFAWLSAYATMIFSSYLYGKVSPKPKPTAVTLQPKTEGSIPSPDSPSFGDWLGAEGNFEKLLGNLGK